MMDYGLVYLATPYAKFADGPNAAFVQACMLTAQLIKKGINAYSPIAHTHSIALYGNLDPHDYSLWLPYDNLMLSKVDSLFIAEMAGWEESIGIKHEVEFFLKTGKPIYGLNPDTLTIIPR